jgi:hypothetical protein
VCWGHLAAAILSLARAGEIRISSVIPERDPLCPTSLGLAALQPGAQVRGQLTLELALGLDEQRRLPHLVRHPHPHVTQEQHRQHRRHLLR